MPEGKYRGVSLSKEMIEAIEKFIEQNPEAGYHSIADFIADAIRGHFKELGYYPESLSLVKINANEMGPLLMDKDLGKTVQIYIKPGMIECGECRKSDCVHVKYALERPQVRQLLKQKQKQGWKLPDV